MESFRDRPAAFFLFHTIELKAATPSAPAAGGSRPRGSGNVCRCTLSWEYSALHR